MLECEKTTWGWYTWARTKKSQERSSLVQEDGRCSLRQMDFPKATSPEPQGHRRAAWLGQVWFSSKSQLPALMWRQQLATLVCCHSSCCPLPRGEWEKVWLPGHFEEGALREMWGAPVVVTSLSDSHCSLQKQMLWFHVNTGSHSFWVWDSERTEGAT